MNNNISLYDLNANSLHEMIFFIDKPQTKANENIGTGKFLQIID